MKDTTIHMCSWASTDCAWQFLSKFSRCEKRFQFRTINLQQLLLFRANFGNLILYVASGCSKLEVAHILKSFPNVAEHNL